MPDDRLVPEHELLLHLQDLDGPVTTAQILEHVRRTNTPTAVTATIERLPDRQRPSIGDAAADVGTGDQPMPTALAEARSDDVVQDFDGLACRDLPRRASICRRAARCSCSAAERVRALTSTSPR